jgi:uncharacterized membrane protein
MSNQMEDRGRPNPAQRVQGFISPINRDHADRIDSLVDQYERNIISRLNKEYERSTSWMDRLADRMADFGGSWRFIVFFACLLMGWTLWNTAAFTFHFDPPPFILLNLCLSFIAAFQAPVIMMSQNRQAARDKEESIIDFAINYKAEREIEDMKDHLQRVEHELREIKELLHSLPPGNEGRYHTE